LDEGSCVAVDLRESEDFINQVVLAVTGPSLVVVYVWIELVTSAGFA
jgi:hypothetical protein